MILESAVIGFVVMILGLLSLTIVTGRPLGQSFRDTQMMGVFFMTGILLSGTILVDVACGVLLGINRSP